MKRINVGFIGAGAFISSTHLKTAGETDFINIAAIADLNEELLAQHCKKYDVGYITTDYKKILTDKDIELVVIGTKQDTHAQLIVESLDAGKWVWCEKPMCETEAEAEAVLAAEKRNPGKLAIGFNRRFAPAVQKALEIMRSKLSRPWIINYRLQSNGSYKTDRKDSFYHNRAHIVYEGCHHLDLISFIMQETPTRVFMSGTGDENDISILEYSDGSRFVFTCTSHAGSTMLEKEVMEIFSSDGAVSIREFTEMRVRGIEGEQDYLFAPCRCPADEMVMQYGFDAWHAFQSRLVEPDRSPAQPLPPVKLACQEQPFHEKIEDIYQQMKSLPFQDRNFQVAKGWTEAFKHFARCCMEKLEPQTANGADGKLANDIAFALLESKKTGMPQKFKNN
ncbi:MAG: Gfo/Idh/MocA family oxidoreductase [Lentisphaeria bacterium]|nr:Gfo/Idh/MocA family oxidoreductase [Lentisphaeria bacterium]